MMVYNLPFDQYQRYKLIEEIVNSIRPNDKRMKILEVGGYPGHIYSFLPKDEIYIIDKIFLKKSNYLCGDGLHLPFKDDVFDFTVSADVLEHISPILREKFISELIRVSNKNIIIAAPFYNQNVVLAEEILYEFLKIRLGVEYHHLKEHMLNGLPGLEELKTFLNSKKLSYFDIPNGYLYHWLFMMMVNFYIDTISEDKKLYTKINQFYNKNFYESDNRELCYRRILVISKNKNMMKSIIRDKYNNINNTNLQNKMDLVNLLNTLVGLEPPLLKKHYETIIKEHETIIKEQKKIIEEKDIHITNLERRPLERIFKRILYLINKYT